MNKRFFAIVICLARLLLPDTAAASTNLTSFAFYNAVGTPLTNLEVTITPIVPYLNTNGFVDTTPIYAETDGTNGTFNLTNLAPGSYYVRGYSTVAITVPGTNYNLSWTNLISGMTVPGANAVYTRAQSDGRYFQVTNASVTGMISSNTTLVGTNFYGAGGTNYATIATNVTLTWGTLFAPGTSSNQAISFPGLDSNGDWEITVTPCLTVELSVTDMLFDAWASNSALVVRAINASSNIFNTPATNAYRIVARQWQ